MKTFVLDIGKKIESTDTPLTLNLFFFLFACSNLCLCAGMQVLEWNGVLLTGKTYEEVQGLVGQPCNEAEVCVRL